MSYLTVQGNTVSIDPSLSTDFGNSLLTGFVNGFNMLLNFIINVGPVLITLGFVMLIVFFIWRKLKR